MKRRFQDWKEKNHNQILNSIFQNPEELGKNVPPIETIIIKIKEPYLPGFSRSNNKYRGSIIDLIFIYTHEINEICAIELKTGTHNGHLDHGFYQIQRTRSYFINNWKEWILLDGIKNKTCSSLDFYFTGMLLVEKHFEPIENWVKARCRTKLGKI